MATLFTKQNPNLMKLKRLLFLLFISPSFVNAQSFYKTSFFVIKGYIKNFKEPLFDFGTTTYFRNTSKSVKVLPNGNFEQQFPIQHRQDIYLYLNDDAIAFAVQDKDTIILEWDEADFKNTFTIKGNNEIRTKELKLQWKLYAGFRKPLMQLHEKLYSDKKLTAEDKYELVNGLYNRNLQAVFDSTDFNSENLNYLTTNLYFQYTNLLWSHKLIPKFKLELALDTTRSYPGVDIFETSADYTRLNEIWFWNCPEYRDFIYNYVRFYKPFNGWLAISNNPAKPFTPTLDEFYLAQSNITLTNIKDWFITQSIISGFGHYAFVDVEKVYKQAISSISSTYLKDTLQKYYSAIKRLKPGNQAPGFTLKNDKGQSVSLSDFKGKVVYIDFWGVGCGPCIYDIKNNVPKLHEHYKKKDVVFVNICVDSKDKEWKDALEKYKLDGVNLIAEGWTNHPVCKTYNVSSIPHYILIDKNGKMVNNNASGAYGFNLTNGKNEIDLLLK